MMKINIASPQIGKEENRAVTAVLKSGMLAQGPKVKEFEEKFAKFIGVKFAIATSSGTTALEVALRAHGIGSGDEVITTPFTFIASANSIFYTGAKPVFVDINEKTFNIDPEKIEKAITKSAGRRTKAIMPVHLYGASCDMTKIMAIAKKYQLAVIEDACQAHGSEWQGKKVGSFGVGAFSFYPTKNMTTGEGGMLTTDSEEIYEKANLLRAHGSKIKYYHEILGYNYRMTDIAGAIGIEQLKKLNKFNQQRLKNAKYLNKQLGKIEGIIVPKGVPKGVPEYSSSDSEKFDSSRLTPRTISKHVYHQYTVRITSEFGLSRNEVLKKLTEAGIGTAVFYSLPINEQKVYKDLGYKDNTPIAKKVSEEVLSLPVHPGLKEKDLRYIVKIISKIKVQKSK